MPERRKSHAGLAAMAPSAAAGTPSVVEEYRGLVDKSFSKFSRLREFPPYGRNKWDTYFHKAFQVYSKLWKFQQENRQKLVETGLQRWEIGEIASRIGQLYYNYYLRTSDGKFLSESYIFYEAIVSREYFKDTGKDPMVANKHLRFYARFIVVCLLLNRREMVCHLVRQFRSLVDDYSHLFQGNDAKEWKLVGQEIMRFMKVDAACESARPLRYSVVLDPHPSSVSEIVPGEGGRNLRLQDAILASYHHNEVKFNELTLDTFRMLQSIEWEPSGMLYKPRPVDATANAAAAGTAGVSKATLQLQIPDSSLQPNPHKYLLYRPTVSSLLLVLATACDELSPDAVLLLYLSAAGGSFAGRPPRSSHAGVNSVSSGSEVNLESPTEIPKRSASGDPTSANPCQDQTGIPSATYQSNGRQHSGIQAALDSHSSATSGGLWLGSKRSSGVNYLFPSDLLPFTRRPLIIVIDSDNSSVFEVISGRERGEPAALLLSPALQVQAVDEHYISGSSQSVNCGGNLFTFFLTAPALAFCRVVGVSAPGLQPDVYDELEKLISGLSSQLGDLLALSSGLSSTWAQIIRDPFLRQLVFRFVLCRATFGLHVSYRSRGECMPRCCPRLPDEASPAHKVVEMGVFQLARKLDVVDQFAFSPAIVEPPRSNGELKWRSPSRSKRQVSQEDALDDERSDSSEAGRSSTVHSFVEGSECPVKIATEQY